MGTSISIVLSKRSVQKYISYGLRSVSDIGGGDLMVTSRLLITPGKSRLGIGISVTIILN